MDWHAIVPLKRGMNAKSRLATRLSADERRALSHAMATHVLASLAAAGLTVRVLSPKPWPDLPWEPDGGAGLNRELERVRDTLGTTALLVIHGDLPLLEPADITALLAAAEAHGAAIAPDRHGTGTNAVALADGRAFAFAFGAGSCAAHIAAAGAGAAIVRRVGLSLDVDTPDDLDELARRRRG